SQDRLERTASVHRKARQQVEHSQHQVQARGEPPEQARLGGEIGQSPIPVATAASSRLLAGPAREMVTEASAEDLWGRYWVWPPHRVRAMWSTCPPKAFALRAWEISWTSTETIRKTAMA